MVSRLASWSGKLVSSVQSLSCVPLLWTHGLQHTRLLCPSPTPGACSNSCPLSRWCNPTVSSSVVLFCFQSFPAWGSFQMSQLFTSGGQSIAVSASASVLPMNIQWLISFRIDWLDLLTVQGTLKESSPTPQFKSIHSLAAGGRPQFLPSFSPCGPLPRTAWVSSCTVAGFPSQRNWGEKLQGFQTSLRIYAPPFSSQSIPPTDQLWLTRLLDQVRVTGGILEVGYHVLYVGVPCFYNVIYPGALSSSLQRKLPDYKAITIITVYPMTGCTIALLIDMYCYIDLVCSLLLWEITHQWTTWHLCLFLSVQV